MAEHRHEVTDIKGYRQLSAAEIKLINELKALEAGALEWLNDMEHRVRAGTGEAYNLRSLALARTGLQEAFMWWIRSVSRPDGE